MDTRTPPNGVIAIDREQDAALRRHAVAITAALVFAIVACALALVAALRRPTAPAAPPPIVHVAAPPACPPCPACGACAPSLACPAPAHHHRGAP